MIALLRNRALRAFALGAAVWLGLKVLRIRNARAEMTAWRIVLFVSLAMPLLLHFVGAVGKRDNLGADAAAGDRP
jgi:hypothetical protein